MARICRSCNAPVPDGNLFCTNCGQRVDVAAEAPAPTGRPGCPTCGAAVDPSALFCTSCGTRISGTAPEPTPAGNLCTVCSAPLKDGAVFCVNCGARVETAEATPLVEPDAGAYAREAVGAAAAAAAPRSGSYFYIPGDFPI